MSRRHHTATPGHRAARWRRSRALTRMLRRDRRPLSVETAAKIHASHVRPVAFRPDLG